jgi:urease alpha subunit
VPNDISRRELIRQAAVGAMTIAGGGRLAAGQQPPTTAPLRRRDADLVLANGKFVDGRGMVASMLTIRDGRIHAIGERVAVAPDARTIDLGAAPWCPD